MIFPYFKLYYKVTKPKIQQYLPKNTRINRTEKKAQHRHAHSQFIWQRTNNKEQENESSLINGIQKTEQLCAIE